jgi:type IV secretory pathway VirD2 relaxase
MTKDDEFEPKLGHPRHDRAGAVRRATGKVRFNGNRIGRGAGAGRVLRARDRYVAFRSRRVVIQTRIVKIMGHGTNRVRMHLRYLQREGVTRDGAAGQLYGADTDRTDGRDFVERADGDRHQFRFIVSPEDGAQYEDLKPFVRRLMAQMESDLETKLDWVAVDHHNTGHPHTHIVVRGKDDTGADLVIAREYISHGMRERAAEIVSLDLGPRTDLEIRNRLSREVQQERFTSLDGDLMRQMDGDRTVTLTGEAFRQSLRAGRLRKLERLGLAEEVGPGKFRLDGDLRAVLQRLGERGDIIKTLHREMTAQERQGRDYAIYDPAEVGASRLTGEVVARGMADQFHDRPYLIVDALDGRMHFVRLGVKDEGREISNGAVVAIEPRLVAPKFSDQTIAKIASANDGRYSAELHHQYDVTAKSDFVEAHLRRLEALRKSGDGLVRDPDGTWTIPEDYLSRARVHESRDVKDSPVRVEVLSSLPIKQQMIADGATWLDRELIAPSGEPLASTGFGREVREALERRRQWLMAEGLAAEKDGAISYPRDVIETLRRREVARVADQLSGELGLRYAEMRPGQRIEGTYRRAVDLASGKFALIEKSHEFTLVPWRDVLEQRQGQSVSGIARNETISWDFGRTRSGPSIS